SVAWPPLPPGDRSPFRTATEPDAERRARWNPSGDALGHPCTKARRTREGRLAGPGCETGKTAAPYGPRLRGDRTLRPTGTAPPARAAHRTPHMYRTAAPPGRRGLHGEVPVQGPRRGAMRRCPAADLRIGPGSRSSRSRASRKGVSTVAGRSLSGWDGGGRWEVDRFGPAGESMSEVDPPLPRRFGSRDHHAGAGGYSGRVMSAATDVALPTSRLR